MIEARVDYEERIMSDKKSFNIVPDIRLLVDIGQANYQVPEAISELIANSMDAKLVDKEITIDVEIAENRISLIDDGKGMSQNVLGEALRLAAQMDQFTGNTQNRKGMYGLGMKAACSSLGSHWNIVSKPQGDNYEYSIVLDLNEWLKKADRQGWEVVVTKALHDPKTSALGNREHGTAIIITKLRDSETFPTAVIEKLSMAYRPHLLAGDKIVVNQNLVSAKSYELIDNRTWDINLEVNGHKITGWYGLDIRTHNDGNYGINIYRQGQLVEAWNKDFLRQHLMSSRVVGEIELPFIAANFHKLGFNKSTEEWKIVKKVMTTELKQAVKASGDMAKNKQDPMRQAKAIKGLDIALGIAGATLSHQNAHPIPESHVVETGVEQPDATQESMILIQTMNQIVLDGDVYSLSYKFDVITDPTIPWDFLFESKSKDLLAVINTESRLYQTSTDQEFVGILALSEAVVGFLIRDLGYTYAKARELRDNWLFDALSSRVRAN
ncbi:MAG: hypothetical protein F2839_06930 [Actinobacteria bacterium]|nr:hypothetical protein [Actinomycetota bacterium]